MRTYLLAILFPVILLCVFATLRDKLIFCVTSVINSSPHINEQNEFSDEGIFTYKNTKYASAITHLLAPILFMPVPFDSSAAHWCSSSDLQWGSKSKKNSPASHFWKFLFPAFAYLAHWQVTQNKLQIKACQRVKFPICWLMRIRKPYFSDNILKN